MKKHEQRQLKLWKARQEAEGHDVSGVNTLEDARHFFDKKKPAANPTPSGQQKQTDGKPKKPAAKKTSAKTPKGA